MDKVSALHGLTVLCHRERYGKADGTYNEAQVNDMVDQIQALAGDIYNDKQKHDNYSKENDIAVTGAFNLARKVIHNDNG